MINNAQVYNPATNQWSSLPEMNTPRWVWAANQGFPLTVYTRSNFSLVVLDGLLTAVGGFTGLPGRLTASMEVLNGGDWLLLSDASPYAKSGIACAVLPNASEEKEEEMEEE